MDDSPSFSTPSFNRRPVLPVRTTVPDDRVVQSEDTTLEADPVAPPAKRRKAGREIEFTGPLSPAQFKLPTDLIQSLRLTAIDTGENMSEIVLRCMTSPDMLAKCWVSGRGRRDAS